MTQSMFLTSENELKAEWIKTSLEELVKNRFDNWFKVKNSKDEVKLFFEKENILSFVIDTPKELSVEFSKNEFFNYLMFSCIEHLSEQINGMISVDKIQKNNNQKYPSYKNWLLAKSVHLPENLRQLNVSMIINETNLLFRNF